MTFWTFLICLIPLIAHNEPFQIEEQNNISYGKSESNLLYDPIVSISCKPDYMIISITGINQNGNGLFTGMIYPKGLPKNSTCLFVYRNHKEPLIFKLPLRGCNTMPQEPESGEIEFFNTIVLQPHLKLVTDMGRGFHVRCKYKSRSGAISKSIFRSSPHESSKNLNQRNSEVFFKSDRTEFSKALSFELPSYMKMTKENNSKEVFNELKDLIEDFKMTMPEVHMKIFSGNKIAENVNIGEELKIVINIEKQNHFGFIIGDCFVRDGLGWGEQRLYDENGCPTDYEIMGKFKYDNISFAASVSFPAHKFPYAISVYYQCNIRLCNISDPMCLQDSCGVKRRDKRQTHLQKEIIDLPATIEVFSGLYVNENAEINESNSNDVIRKKADEDNQLCVTQRVFAIAIAVAGLVLMLTIIAAVICIMTRKSGKTYSNSDSSIYSGPYANTVFSHSS